MKYRLIELLSCPECKGRVVLKKVFREGISSSPAAANTRFCEDYCALQKSSAKGKPIETCRQCYQKEIVEGLLACKCGRQFPIIKAIPRMLPDDLFSIILQEYPAFFKIHKMKIPSGQKTVETKKKVKTQKNFGSKWKSFNQVDDKEYEQEFLDWIRPIEKGYFKGKLIIEGGCGGMGNHLRYSQKFGGNVVGIDLSVGVDSSYANTKHLPNIYIVQGDLTRIPLMPAFDFGYSIGVLHHLPVPSVGLKNIADRVKKGGKVAVWVYGKEGDFFRVYILMPAKKVLTKLPNWTIKGLSWPLTIVYYPIAKSCLALDKAFPESKKLAKLPYYTYFVHRSRDNFIYQKALVYDHLVSPVDHHFSQEDMKEFFKAAGLTNVVLTPWKGVSWTGVGRVHRK